MFKGIHKNFGESPAVTGSVFDYFKFDPEIPPTPTKDVVFLSGSWYQMGVQYGAQARDAVHRRVALFVPSSLRKAGSYDRLYRDMETYVEYFEKDFPEYNQFLLGIADAAGLGFLDVVACYSVYYPLEPNNCSNVSVWGEGTKDGRLIAGGNWDYEGNSRVYEPAVVAYPEGGNAFISSSGLSSTTMLNDKGLAILGSGGQSEAPGDTKAPGWHYLAPHLYVAAKCSSAEEARDAYLYSGVSPCLGCNFHVADTKHNAYIIEHTAGYRAVRKSGDYGEKDYLVATNHFLAPEMQNSLCTGATEWTDCVPRYGTEECVLIDNYGQNTLDTVADSIGSTDYYYEGKWTRDVWSLEHRKGRWTPENRDIYCKCVMRGIIDPERQSFYIMAGCRDTLASERPYATGNFSRLVLKDKPCDVVTSAKAYAQAQIWLGGRDIARAGRNDAARIEYLNKAKVCEYAGQNYMNLADCAFDSNERLALYGKAASSFCRAQCYGQLAQDNPTAVERETQG